MIPSDKVKLNIHNNSSQQEECNVIHVSYDISLTALLREAGEKVGVPRATKLFLASGMDLETPEALRNNDHLYVSAGEKFFRHEQGDSSVTRVSILGGGGVGKSAITLRFVRDFFVQNWEATIEDAYRKTMKVDGEAVTLEILDTAGQEDFSTLRAQWMMDKEGYIFVYSLVDRESVDQLYAFVELLEQVYIGALKDCYRNVIIEGRAQVCVGLAAVPPIIFVGNKKDLTDSRPEHRAVKPEDVAHLMKACEDMSRRVMLQRNVNGEVKNAEGWPMLHFEASALSGERIDEMFEILVREIKDRKKRTPTVEKKKTSWLGKWCTIL